MLLKLPGKPRRVESVPGRMVQKRPDDPAVQTLLTHLEEVESTPRTKDTADLADRGSPIRHMVQGSPIDHCVVRGAFDRYGRHITDE